MQFKLNEKDIKNKLNNVTNSDIEKSLNKNSNYNIYDFINLISEPAEKYIEILAQKANKITLQRFGKTIKLYTPIYVSNICINNCVYCGFNKNNKIKRITLTFSEIEQECKKIKELGFDNILLLTGSAPEITDINYLKKCVQILKKYFSYIGIEIFPLTCEQYKTIINTGVDSLTLYQETYIRELYKKLHLSGPKQDYDFRLDAPERAGKAGIKDIGLGVLLGLYDWRIDTSFMVQHAEYLIKKFWKTKINFSFPRIQPAAGGFKPLSKVTDRNMVQLISVLRIMFNDSELLLSTRENKNIRNNFLNIGITQISAGSKTNPGGYSNLKKGDNQFDISDKRSVKEIIEFLKSKGFDPVIKNWDNKYKSNIG